MSKPDLVPLLPTSALLVGLGRRLCALFYEALLLVAVVLVLGGLFQLVVTARPTEQWWCIMHFVYEMILVFAYFGFCWVKGGQTLAMKTWQMRLCQADGAPIGWTHALIRYLIVFIAVTPFAPISIFVAHDVLPGYYTWLALIWAALPYLWALVDK